MKQQMRNGIGSMSTLLMFPALVIAIIFFAFCPGRSGATAIQPGDGSDTNKPVAAADQTDASDSTSTNFPMLSVDDLADLSSFARKLKWTPRPIDHFLADQMSAETKTGLSHYSGIDRSVPVSLQKALVSDLNKFIHGPSIYESQRFKEVILELDTRQLLAQNPQGEALQRLNCWLLADAYKLKFTLGGIRGGDPSGGRIGGKDYSRPPIKQQKDQ